MYVSIMILVKQMTTSKGFRHHYNRIYRIRFHETTQLLGTNPGGMDLKIFKYEFFNHHSDEVKL